MLPGTIFQAFHRFLCHIQHLFCHVTSWDDSIFELFPPFGRTIGIHYLPSPFNTPNWRSHRVTHFEIHFHLKKGLSFGQDSMISPHFNQTFYHAALCFKPFSTLISVDKSHIVSWRSYPLSMHGQELRGDTHLLVMLWYQSGSMDSTQGYSLASWLDFQCLCWTSWWLSLPTPWSSPACQSLAWHCEIMGFSVQAATSIVDVGKCKGHWVGQGDVGLHCVCSELRVAWFHDKFWCWVSFSMVTSN